MSREPHLPRYVTYQIRTLLCGFPLRNLSPLYREVNGILFFVHTTQWFFFSYLDIGLVSGSASFKSEPKTLSTISRMIVRCYASYSAVPVPLPSLTLSKHSTYYFLIDVA